MVSIVIPTYNEECCIGHTIRAISRLQGDFEVIVADGGSTDRTVAIAEKLATVVHAPRGRGPQQAEGASAARGNVLWFLHADTIPAADALASIRLALADPRVAGGNFSLRFDGDIRAARQLTSIYPYLRLIGLCYGDSGIFVRSSVYKACGGFMPYPLFEDVDLVRRIRRHGAFRTLPETLVTSSRRFEHRNFARVFAEWTALQMLYWAGVSPNRLAQMYAPVRRRQRNAG